MFRRAEMGDLTAIAAIYDEIHAEIEAGRASIGWIRGVYPTRATAEAAISLGDMYVEIENGEIVAAARINQHQGPEYDGASWSFALWGLWHGLFLCLERIPAVKRVQEKLPGWVNWLYTIIVVLLGWVLFRADDLGMAARYLSDMFTLEGVWIDEIGSLQRWAALGLGALFSIKLPRPKLNGFTETLYTLAALALLAACAVYLAGGTYNPFIYFRF